MSLPELLPKLPPTITTDDQRRELPPTIKAKALA
jgi:hypothetical protein